MINGIHHVSLSTADMDRFLDFYHGLLGIPLKSDSWLEPGFAPFETIVGLADTRVRIAQLHAGNLRIEVFQYEQPSPLPGTALRPCDVGIRHLAFDVTGIDAEYARLKAAGVASISAPQTLGEHGMRSVYLRDPDQNIVELQEILPGSRADKAHVIGFPAQ